MYKCTECNEKYKVKPEYCKCGNDEFEEIKEIEKPLTSDIENSSQKTFEKSISKIPKGLIFQISYIVFCIILAIIPWLFKTEKAAPTTEQTVQKPVQNIPDIETIWSDEIATPVQKPADEPEIVKAVEKVINKVISPKPVQKSSTVKTQPETQTTRQIKKPVQNKQQTSKPVPKTTQPVNTSAKQQKTTDAKPKLPQSVLNPKKVETQKPKPKPEPPQMNQQEFLQYKAEIRSALLAKLNITAVSGTGDCAVEFSIDNSGKLINRNFIYKSSNKSLNDEVYLMLMRLPYFKQPPKYYNGEKIRLKFYINNGYYEITFL